MLRTIKRHVLQEVSQTTLILVLLNRTNTLRNVEIGYMLRPIIVEDVVSQAIAKLTLPYILIHRNRSHLLCRDHTSDEK